MSTYEDIQDHHREQMKSLAGAIDGILNGDERPRKVGFALLMFDFDGPNSDRINYISNAKRADMTIAIKELVSRLEGRHIEETQTPLPAEPQ